MKLLLSIAMALCMQTYTVYAAEELDTDGDTIPDHIEDANGNGIVDAGETDPNNADSDHGGESDGQELILGQNPLDKSDDQTSDIDGDGVISRLEKEMGTDPNNPDTDGDGTQDGQDPFPLLKLYSKDTDKDGMPDAWETENGLNPNNPADAIADADLDGLNNLQEFQVGSSPTLKDTDNDTLSDAFEAALGTNPNSTDTDNDGIDDANELQNGTNPQQSDSDNDGTPDNLDVFPQNSAYSIDTDKDGIPDAWEKTRGLNSNNNLDAQQDADSDGLTNLQEFQSSTNPNVQDTDGDGVQDGKEIAIGSNPLVVDSDGDGIKDGQEIAQGTNPVLQDSDRDGVNDTIDPFPLEAKYTKDSDKDGLPDAWEIAHGFNPNNASDAIEDADGDGLTNTEEFALGTWPNKQDSDGDGITDGQDNFPLLAQYANDADSDGLPDEWEIAHGLNPHNPDDAKQDDDGDTLSNSEEFKHNTDPNNADSDDDGLQDSIEIELGLNPLQKDSDNDGTPDAEDIVPKDPRYSKDSDNDGLPDEWELQYGLDPYDATDAAFDTDKDNLTNIEEFLQNTNPIQTDTDRDGMPDGQESKEGKDPSMNGCLSYGITTYSFADMNGHWADEIVLHLSRTKTIQDDTAIFSGYSFGDPIYNLKAFFPNKPITRFELLKIAMLSNCIALKTDADLSALTFAFSDLPHSEQSEKNIYIYSAFAYGIVQGYPDGTFVPDKPVNRAEALKILLESAQIALKDPQNSVEDFSDVAPTSWFANYTTIARSRGIVEGYSGNTFKPEQLMSRAEAAKIILQIMMQNPHVNGSVIPLYAKKETP